MSEVMTNQAAMYDSVEAIRNLNSVEGFNPQGFYEGDTGGRRKRQVLSGCGVPQALVPFKVPGGKNQQAAVKVGE